MVGRIRFVTFISLLVCILSGCSKPASESGAAKPNDPTPAPICSHDEIEYNEIISQEVISNTASETFDFKVVYKNPPQFLLTDCHKRQAHAFQFYIAYDTNEIPANDESWDVIVRGGEIYLDGKIRLRDANRMGPHDGEESGGWGPLMTSSGIDYQISGSTVLFSIPWDIIGDADGSIYYDLLNTNYGGMNLLVKNTLVE